MGNLKLTRKVYQDTRRSFKNKKITFEDDYITVCENDPVFADMLDHFHDQLAAITKKYYGSIVLMTPKGDEEFLVKLSEATQVLSEAMLSLYHLMQEQHNHEYAKIQHKNESS